MKYYPLNMNIEGRECLVVGAGAVAARKAKSLLECGAIVTVIGEGPVASLRRLEGERLKIRPRKFRRSDMKNYALVFGATDDAGVNKALYRESRRRGLPVNVAISRSCAPLSCPLTIAGGTFPSPCRRGGRVRPRPGPSGRTSRSDTAGSTPSSSISLELTGSV